MERPTGVTILAVLCFIFAGLSVLGSLVFFAGGAALSRMGGASMGAGMMLAGLGAAAGAIILVLAALYALVGYGLWTLKKWGRILAIAFVALGLLFAAAGLLNSVTLFRPLLALRELIVMAIDVWIIWYLLRPHVKQAFGATSV